MDDLLGFVFALVHMGNGSPLLSSEGKKSDETICNQKGMKITGSLPAGQARFVNCMIVYTEHCSSRSLTELYQESQQPRPKGV